MYYNSDQVLILTSANNISTIRVLFQRPVFLIIPLFLSNRLGILEESSDQVVYPYRFSISHIRKSNQSVTYDRR